MAKNEKRVQVTLACEDCKRRNYITMKNKVNDRERIEMKKYCQWERKHTAAQGDPLGTSPVRGGKIDFPAATLGFWRGTQRAVAQLVEHRSPKPVVGGSSPSCPARRCFDRSNDVRTKDVR